MLFTLPELASYLPDTAGNPERAELLSDLAHGLIYAVADEETVADSLVAKGIALEVTARAYRNTDGISSETVDDYTYRREAATRSPGVYLTGEERAALSGLTATPVARVRSKRLRSWSAPYDTTVVEDSWL